VPQHLPYRVPSDGYYYFRPYNAWQIAGEQDFVRSIGQDPRNPVDNRFFQEIYRRQASLPAQMPANLSVDDPPRPAELIAPAESRAAGEPLLLGPAAERAGLEPQRATFHR
jgi:hypothetical protein